jgi:hypothetical protein
MFKTDSDPDPKDAMALAPAEALIAPNAAQPATQSEKRPANAPSAQETDEERVKASRKAGPIKPTCRESLGEVPEGDCTSVRVVRVRPLRAVNERPLIAAVPIGHRDDPAVLPTPPTTVSPSASVPPEEPKATTAPMETTVVEATPADATPAAEPTSPAPTPAVSSKKPRPRVHHAQDESRRRNHYSYVSSYNGRSSSEGSWSYGVRSSPSSYFQGGYARVW